ncbi:hypothetical protein EPN95_04645 [Patescibacteria group bacterium]|nr:MAG: hypothetical protein EPN95_04645 [Patescibacteria group bacterium]
MPKPTLGDGQTFIIPPDTGNPALDDYLLMLHHRLFGLLNTGDLDNDNIRSASLTGILHANLGGITSYEHHGAGNHKELGQGAISADALASTVAVGASDANTSTVSVTTADADATYGAAEADLLNEMKGDINALVADYNTCKILTNELKLDLTQLTTDINAIVTSLNDLKSKLRTAKILAT